MLCTSETTVDSAVDADATPLCLAETAVEIPADKTAESVSCSADPMLDKDVEIEATSLCLDNVAFEMPVESDVSLLCVDEMNVDNSDDTAVTEFVRVNVAVEMLLDIVSSAACNREAAVDSDVDTDATPLTLAATLDVSDGSVTLIMEYRDGPASSAAAISNSVSREEGAAPTKVVIAFSTWDDRFMI